jgi:hypothetical protein
MEADKVYGKNSKNVARYHISPLVLEEMDKARDQLIEQSKRYWMRIYMQLGLKSRK